MAPQKTEKTLQGRVLIVDDEADLREVLAYFLGDLGMSIVEARDGQEALEFLKANPVELVITDMHMPNMSGEKLILEAQKIQKNKDTKYILCTGAVKASHEGLPHHGILSKPFSRDSLYSVVSQALNVANKAVA